MLFKDMLTSDVVVLSTDDVMEYVIIGLVIFVVIAIIGACVGLSKGKKRNAELYGDNSLPTQVIHKNAKIVSKRTAPDPVRPTVMVNWIVFEFDDKNRLELAIKDNSVFGIMVEGDEGELAYQGKRFISFTRT
ncbi:MAG: DUF2500 family protein [Eubacteriales bacterium]|nr:DUF2500 family protein [Eubacteriales bacterium]